MTHKDYIKIAAVFADFTDLKNPEAAHAVECIVNATMRMLKADNERFDVVIFSNAVYHKKEK